MHYQILTPSKNTLGIFCLFVTLTILAAGLWPFNFWPENEVKWLKDRNGVHFYGRGIIFNETKGDNDQHPFFPIEPITLEIWLQPDDEPNSYLPHILSSYDGKESEGFFLAQWQSTLILRTKVLSPKGVWTYRGVGVGNALLKGQRRFIAITSNGKRTDIYMDGRLEGSFPGFAFIPKDRTTLNQIILGNSPTGRAYWKGNVFGLAIYNRSLDADQAIQHFKNWMEGKVFFSMEDEPSAIYLFNERSGTQIHNIINHHILSIPPRFVVPQKIPLVPPWSDFRHNFSYFKDIVLNILGFIPFGFLLSAYLYDKKIIAFRKLLIIVLLLGGFLSFIIEILQIYLPTRSSQLMDLLSNLSGTALGLVLFNFYHLRKLPFERNLK